MDERKRQALAAVAPAEVDEDTDFDIDVVADDIEEFAEKAVGWQEVVAGGELGQVDWKTVAWKPEAGDGDDGMVNV